MQPSQPPTADRATTLQPTASPAATPYDADVAAIARIGAVPTILKVVAEVTGLRLALIARVTPDAWVACAVLDQMNFGLSVGDHLAVATTLCSEVRDSHQPIVIEHASQDPEFCEHATPRMYGFESYIAVPIFRPNGDYFGNVCALDSAPRTLRDRKTLGMMQLFAELISLQLTAEEESVRDRAALSDERRTAELREQFIAVLGHDLRNSIFAVLSGASFLLNSQPEAKQQRTVLERIRVSGQRMARLVDDVLDFARGRLGGGMPIRREEVDVAEVVGDVVDEIASAHAERTIRVTSGDAGVALLDRSRLAQLLSNLVANAVQHSPETEPVDVVVERQGDHMVFSIVSRGAPIPPAVMQRLFQPYVRTDANQQRTGLGLGLFIASEIARAHGGGIAVKSSAGGETTFTVRLPRAVAG